MSADLPCPKCGEQTEDYAAHCAPGGDGQPALPVQWLTRWGADPDCDDPFAVRFERTAEGRGRWGARSEYRYGIVIDRVCWPCETTMPRSACERAR